MAGKTQGSAGPYVTVAEAARLLGIGSDQVHHLDRGRLLEGHYPEGRKAGKRFLEEDVHALVELRRETAGGLTPKLPRLAMRAVLVSRRAERKVDRLLHYLGLDADPLPSDREGALAIHHRVDAWLRKGGSSDPSTLHELARTLLAITEEYLELVGQATGDPECWRIYFELGAMLAQKVDPNDPLRAYVEHARRNARNVAYLRLREMKGARVADRQMPGERYSDQLLRAWPGL
jgi:hypothetical protein